MGYEDQVIKMRLQFYKNKTSYHTKLNMNFPQIPGLTPEMITDLREVAVLPNRNPQVVLLLVVMIHVPLDGIERGHRRVRRFDQPLVAPLSREPTRKTKGAAKKTDTRKRRPEERCAEPKRYPMLLIIVAPDNIVFAMQLEQIHRGVSQLVNFQPGLGPKVLQQNHQRHQNRRAGFPGLAHCQV
jgi:hypothetical protein